MFHNELFPFCGNLLVLLYIKKYGLMIIDFQTVIYF